MKEKKYLPTCFKEALKRGYIRKRIPGLLKSE